jgi:hypothetical protein
MLRSMTMTRAMPARATERPEVELTDLDVVAGECIAKASSWASRNCVVASASPVR